MKQWMAWCVLISMILSVEALAGKPVRVELNDGSVIEGEIVSVGSGVYTLKSDSLGVLKIDESKIRTIRIGRSLGEAQSQQVSTPASTPSSVSQQAQALRDRMTGNEEIMSLITSLAKDPDIQAVLKDENIMSAVKSGDIQALTSNPDFMKLLDKPAVRSIIKKSTQ